MIQPKELLHQSLIAAVQEDLTPEMEALADVWGYTATEAEWTQTPYDPVYFNRIRDAGFAVLHNTDYNGYFLATDDADGFARFEISAADPRRSIEWFLSTWNSQAVAKRWQAQGSKQPLQLLSAQADHIHTQMAAMQEATAGCPFPSMWQLPDGLAPTENPAVLAEILPQPGRDDLSEATDALPPVQAEIIRRHGFRILTKSADEGDVCFLERQIRFAPAYRFTVSQSDPRREIQKEADSFRAWRKPMIWRGDSPAPGIYLLGAAISLRNDLRSLSADLNRICTMNDG